jgi:hypothetical protein
MSDEQVMRQEDDGEPERQAHIYGPSGLAAYRWLLRRLFAGDTTPPPVEDSAEESSRALDLRVRIIQTDEPPSSAWRALWDRLLAPPPTEPDEGE